MTSDLDLADMREVKAGRLDRFASLVGRHQSGLFRYAQSVLGSRSLAEDAVQETFMAAFKSRDSFDLGRPFRSWLWAIHVNSCRRLARNNSSKASPQPPVDELPELPGRERPADWRMEREDDRHRLERALEQLPAEQADAIRMRFFGELGYDEIGDATACAPATAKSRVRYGLTKLASLLESGQEIFS